jgi:hypothetical protein
MVALAIPLGIIILIFIDNSQSNGLDSLPACLEKGVQMLSQFVMELAGWLPGVIFPGATALQLYKIWKGGTAKGVSISTWSLFAIANVGLYIYTQRYDSLQLIVGLLGTAVLDAVIVVLALTQERKERKGRTTKVLPR